MYCDNAMLRILLTQDLRVTIPHNSTSVIMHSFRSVAYLPKLICHMDTFCSEKTILLIYTLGWYGKFTYWLMSFFPFTVMIILQEPRCQMQLSKCGIAGARSMPSCSQSSLQWIPSTSQCMKHTLSSLCSPTVACYESTTHRDVILLMMKHSQKWCLCMESDVL